ncbi:glutaminase A [Kitasatospora sp. NPDC003701]
MADGRTARSSDAQGTYRALFRALNNGRPVSPAGLVARLRSAGILEDDPRIAGILGAAAQEEGLGLAEFTAVVQQCSGLVQRTLRGSLVVPEFAELAGRIASIYQDLLPLRDGTVASYIPQLARVDPEQLAVSVCTVDGQRYTVGDGDVPFCLQSVSKTVGYCLALEEHGVEATHRHVGREPSGQGFNGLALDRFGHPHNPMVNAGAIMSCALIRPDLPPADRFDLVAQTWRRLSGGSRPWFNNAVCLSERETADRNYALAYSMRERHAFPPGTDMQAALEFYFQCCSIEVTSRMLATAAASFANGGVCPLTTDRVFSEETVQHCLSLMASCGMYDYSGEFAFTVGLPAKSGVSGALMIVIPRLAGICVWSPRLDELGNSVRGIEFCRRLEQAYNIHPLTPPTLGTRTDLRLRRNQSTVENTVGLCWAARQGDLDDIRRYAAAGADLAGADYDGRTPLHLAASEGRVRIVRYLLAHGVPTTSADRWGNTPLDDAEREGHDKVARILRGAAGPALPRRRSAPPAPRRRATGSTDRGSASP